MGSRRQARENALQALYQCDTLSDWSKNCVDLYFHSFHTEEEGDHKGTFDPEEHEFARILIDGAIANLDAIDACIAASSQNWSISRMSRVDRNILRVGAFEICYLPDVPPNVSINEAIEVAKKYAADDSPMFINGVLDKVATVIKENGGMPTHFIRKVANG